MFDNETSVEDPMKGIIFCDVKEGPAMRPLQGTFPMRSVNLIIFLVV